MKTNYLKRSLWLAAILLTSLGVRAQTQTTTKTAYDDEGSNMYYRIRNDDGKRTERIQTDYEGKIYKMEWVNEKMTSLYVDGEKVPEADWSKYSEVTRRIRQEIKEQAKRNEEQAKRNIEQAKRNEDQNVRNAEQAKRNAEQARLNELQVKNSQDQAVRNEEQEKRNAEQAVRNKEQAKMNAEQGVRNKEQAERNALQAQKNAEQAKANAQMIKDITADLVSDKIISNINGLHEMKLNEFGMSINGIKQTDEVFKKYKEKYSKFFDGNFHYSRDGIIREQ